MRRANNNSNQTDVTPNGGSALRIIRHLEQERNTTIGGCRPDTQFLDKDGCIAAERTKVNGAFVYCHFPLQSGGNFV